ncbi:MAG: DUF5956 family protein [Nocardioides sp.]
MARGDWAVDSDETRFTPEQDSLVGVATDDPAELPGVRAAAALGYEPVPEAPLFCFLPAIWPAGARAWIRDVRIRHGNVSWGEGPSERVPWSAWDYVELEAETNRLLVTCGFDPRPAGRLWLLQPPPGFDSLDAALTHLSASATAAGLPILADRTFAEHVGREVARIFTQP